MLQAGVVFVGTQLAFNLKSFALANIVFVAAWLAVAVAIFVNTSAARGSMRNPLRQVFDFRKQEIPVIILLFLFFFW
jgi:hypothetical protein